MKEIFQSLSFLLVPVLLSTNKRICTGVLFPDVTDRVQSGAGREKKAQKPAKRKKNACSMYNSFRKTLFSFLDLFSLFYQRTV